MTKIEEIFFGTMILCEGVSLLIIVAGALSALF